LKKTPKKYIKKKKKKKSPLKTISAGLCVEGVPIDI